MGRKVYETKDGLKLHHKNQSMHVIDYNKVYERRYVKEAIEKACKKVLEEKLHSKFILNEVEKYWEIITENDIIDLQNKLLTLNFHEKELFYS